MDGAELMGAVVLEAQQMDVVLAGDEVRVDAATSEASRMKFDANELELHGSGS